MNRNAPKAFHSVIIGTGSLPIRCGETLLEKGHKITAIVSSDEDVITWAKRCAIEHFDSVEAFNEHLAGPVDYLFSINNEHILAKNILRLARKYAINYHDAQLPRYAGMHATSWALMNGESTHGITWHVIADKVDAGDILTQRTVDISPDETALSLNAKCYEAAISAFDELVEDLHFDRFKRRRQDLAQRTYFARYKRPKNGGIINWTDRANEISNLLRSLDFGPYPNTLGKAKLAIEGEFFVVTKVEVLKTSSRAMPGTIVSIGREFLQIASADMDILINEISTVDGLPISISQLTQRFELHQGYRLPDIDANLNARIEALLTETARYENYWTAKLSNSNPVSAPYSRTKPSGTIANFRTRQMDLPETVAATASLPGEISLSMKLLAAFGVLLSRLTGSKSFSLGYTDRNISRKIGDLSGLFAATVPLTLDVDSQHSFPQLIGSLSQEVDQIYTSTTYLRDVFTRYPQLVSNGDFASPRGLPVTFAEIDEIGNFAPTIGTDLVLAVSDRECYWIFNSETLDQGDVETISGNLEILLESFAAEPESAVGYLPIISEYERNRLFLASKGRFAEYPKQKCIHQLFEEKAEEFPESTAVICDSDKIGYRDLNKRSNQLARRLIGIGTKPGDLIAIASDRSIESIVSILAVLKAGGTYVPIDPTWPDERLRHIASDAGVSVVISQHRYAKRMTARFPSVICLDSDREPMTDWAGSNPNLVISSESPAYAIYTSGSTGKPKGVLISHRSLVNHAVAISNLYELTSTDRVLQFAPLYFDVTAEEVFPTLLSGAAIVIMSRDVQNSLNQFSEFLFANSISVVNLPTSYWREWTASLVAGDTAVAATIRLVVAGSESVYAEDYNLWCKIARESIRWLNAYGLTETTITSLVYEPSERNVELETVPIGKPIDNTDLYILDRNMQPVPYGIAGELYIGGDGVALGYLNLPDVTAERFVANPFGSVEFKRIYKTGDLVRYLPDGNIAYVDRVDHQVKMRGFRIELGEIEEVLASHPEVAEAVVVATNKKSNETRLTAYFVCRHPVKQPELSDIELWPSVGEYPVYDKLMYYSMSTDVSRTSRYEAAIKKLVKDKVVVEIGTGQDLVLARMCVAAGARKVYAIEALDEAYHGAVALNDSLGLSDRIKVLHGYSTKIDLPEKADVCLSEIIGTIGGSEGAAAILNDARRFLKPDGKMIPERCITRIAAIQLPEDVLNSPHFSELSGKYADKIFQQVGFDFDVRVCLGNLPRGNFLSETGIFEDLDFSQETAADFKTAITLKIKKQGRLDGFLLWLNLHTATGHVIDSINEKSSWLPVYFPAFEPGLDVFPGDAITAFCYGRVSDNGINPDYGIAGELYRFNGEKIDFIFDSFHHKPGFKQTPFYQKLFSPKAVVSRGSGKGEISTSELSNYLAGYLPAYMIPSAIVPLDRMPLTPSGKVDRKALPVFESDVSSRRNGYVAPRTGTEKKLVEIWSDLLGFDHVGITDNFFDLGGHSLLAIRMFTRVEERFRKSIPLATLFEAGTIEKLADILSQDSWREPESAIVPIQPNGRRPPLFCLHAKGGNVLFYRDLAKCLGGDQPFYGIQARRLGGRQVGHATVEEMAENYIEEIKRLQPTGPYFLGGASFGGLAAFEIAQQLHRKGERVALLAMFDTGTPDYPRLLPSTGLLQSYGYALIRRVQLHKENLKALNNKGRFDYVLDKLAKLKLKYKRKVVNTYKKLVRNYYLRNKGDGSIPTNYIQMEDLISKAGERYLPKSFPGKLTLFRASNQPMGIETDHTLGWGPFVSGELEIHEVSGHHGSIVAEPYVRNLAEKLAECIDKLILESGNHSAGPKSRTDDACVSAPSAMAASATPDRKMLGLLLF